MVITQLTIVKELPYAISNILALTTCLPMAVSILMFGKNFSYFFENRSLIAIGTISYEIYLVHAFTLNLIKSSIISICIFVGITYAIAYILHMGIRKVKNDRLNSSYINKK